MPAGIPRPPRPTGRGGRAARRASSAGSGSPRARGDRRSRGAASGPCVLGHGNRPAELDDRRVGEPRKLAVEGGDLRPVAGSSACSDAIAACTTYGPRPRRASARSSTARPAAIWAWSHSERSWSARSTSSPSRKRASRRASQQQHHRQQAVDLGLVGHQLRRARAEPERLVRELAAAAVALVEDQVDDREHGGQPVGQEMVGRDSERDPGGLDLALRADQPLGHRRLLDQECTRDLAGRQAAERPQRERDLRIDRERRMAAGEDELESLVRKSFGVHRVLHRLGHVEQPRLRQRASGRAGSG